MLAELTAIRDLLQATYGPKVAVGIGDMTGHQAPFVSVWGPPAGQPQSMPMGGPRGSRSARVGCTFTGVRTDVALMLAADGIEAITPDRMPNVIAVPGRFVEAEFFDARDVTVDSNVTLPDSNTHPAYVVALFTVHSQPLETP